MSICGIIAEYNPFHNGHSFHIAKAKEVTGAENIMVVMSGNYVQRGEPAIFDKFTRTKMALQNGADLVVELPVYFSTSSAQYFAYSSVNILDKSGICDYICFGSESSDIEHLLSISEILANENILFKQILNNELSKGLSFPNARALAIKSILESKGKEIDTDFLNQPNDILGIEYFKSLAQIKSKIKPFVIKRISAHYHSTDIINEISSATAIRNTLFDNNIDLEHKNILLEKTIPNNCYEMLSNNKNKLDNYSEIFQFLLRTKKPSEISGILDMTEGLENRLIESAGTECKITDILVKTKTKRYTYTKLQRAILHLILDITKNNFNELLINGGSQYIRVLGFNREKEYLVKELSKKSSLPIITNLSNKNKNQTLSPLAQCQLEKELVSTDIYNIGRKDTNKINYEYYSPIIKI